MLVFRGKLPSATHKSDGLFTDLLLKVLHFFRPIILVYLLYPLPKTVLYYIQQAALVLILTLHLLEPKEAIFTVTLFAKQELLCKEGDFKDIRDDLSSGGHQAVRSEREV